MRGAMGCTVEMRRTRRACGWARGKGHFLFRKSSILSFVARAQGTRVCPMSPSYISQPFCHQFPNRAWGGGLLDEPCHTSHQPTRGYALMPEVEVERFPFASPSSSRLTSGSHLEPDANGPFLCSFQMRVVQATQGMLDKFSPAVYLDPGTAPRHPPALLLTSSGKMR